MEPMSNGGRPSERLLKEVTDVVEKAYDEGYTRGYRDGHTEGARALGMPTSQSAPRRQGQAALSTNTLTYNDSVRELGLSTRALKLLEQNSITTIDKLTLLTAEDLAETYGFSAAVIENIRFRCYQQGFLLHETSKPFSDEHEEEPYDG